MDLSPTIQERIFLAADALYAESGKQTFPTVDAVRKSAKVNMNDASTGMKAWRRTQTAQVAPVAVQVPNSLQQSSTSALASLWSEAMTLANETLRAAEAGWNSERAEAEALREQMANAFETQAMELESLKAGVSVIQKEIDRVQVHNNDLQKQLDDASKALSEAEAAARQWEARAIEIEHRADDLRKELDYAHVTITSLNKEMAAQRSAHHAEIETIRTEAAGSKARSDARFAAVQSDLAQAREEVARLQGNLEGLQQKSPPAKAKGRIIKDAAEPSSSLFPDDRKWPSNEEAGKT